jgi:hypothetical protein
LCTVTVTDEQGRRHSLDVEASSTFDAAHLYVAHVKSAVEGQFPIPTAATVFEVVASGRVYHLKGTALQKWILQRRQEWNGPKGLLFRQRPTL